MNLTEDEIESLIYKHFNQRQQSVLLYHKWKDGIECDYLTVEIQNFVKAVIERVKQ